MKRNLILAMLCAVAVLNGCNSDSSRHSVLIDGDSLSLGYTSYVQAELPDWDVFHNPSDVENNGRGSTYAVLNLQDWLNTVGPVDVIHANWGLWDMSRGKFTPENNTWHDCDPAHEPHTSKEQYRANLEVLAGILEKTGSRIIWATTTPVPDANKCVSSSDVPAYNIILVEVAEEHHFSIDDLNGYIAPYPKLHEPDTGIHYSQQGYEFLSFQVANSIRAAL